MAMVVGAKKYDRYHRQQHDEQEHSFDVMQENGNLVRLPSKEASRCRLGSTSMLSWK